MTRAFGYCDGLKGDDLYGWAWHPDAPDEPVAIEVSVDGVVVGDTLATVYRPDLRSAGVGHGRYGWKLSLKEQFRLGGRHMIVARAKAGDPLIDGELDLDLEPPASDFANPAFQSFLASVRQGGRAARRAERPVVDRPTHLFLHCPVSLAVSALGDPEYSYGFVMKTFRPLLETLGPVRTVDDPDEADALCLEALGRGESSILLSFAPAHQTRLGQRCPVVPVIAWEFPNFPIQPWGEDHRNDWRFALRQAGRAITLSTFAADAVRSIMGATFPVAAIPTPSFDRLPAGGVAAAGTGGTIGIDGFVFDTRGRGFEPGSVMPRLPAADADDVPRSVTLDGTIYTSVFSPRDGRKNWMEMVRAFVTAHRETYGATLVLKMIGAEPAHWWWELHEVLNGSRAFRCRIVVLQGYLPLADYHALIAASHWVVNASHAEGLCMPLLEFMSAGRPAIAPDHTAMADYVKPGNALIIRSEEEYCCWPHDPRYDLVTTRHRVSWSALVGAFEEAHRITASDPGRYAALGACARETMRAYCGDARVGAQLSAFLGLTHAGRDLVESPSRLIRELALP